MSSTPPDSFRQTTDTALQAQEAERARLTAIGLMLLALAFFSTLDTAAKWLATREGIPVMQLSWLRFLVQFLGLLILVPALGLMSLERLFTTKKFAKQMVRSTLMAATTLFNFLALQYLRLDQTITIVFLAPLVVAALAGPLLGEWVGWRRAIAIAVGFAGVLIAVRPGFGDVHPAVIYSFLAMAAYALFMLLTRHLAPYDPPLVTLFYSMFVGTLFGAPFALMQWVWPDSWTTWALLLSLGLLGGTGHFLFILAYSRAPASAISPFLYAQLITMVAMGYLVFGDVPDLWTMIGASVIIASGIYLIHRERVTKGLE
jgi:drug/metabolite transporter (DMT)-like permease